MTARMLTRVLLCAALAAGAGCRTVTLFVHPENGYETNAPFVLLWLDDDQEREFVSLVRSHPDVDTWLNPGTKEVQDFLRRVTVQWQDSLLSERKGQHEFVRGDLKDTEYVLLLVGNDERTLAAGRSYLLIPRSRLLHWYSRTGHFRVGPQDVSRGRPAAPRGGEG